MSTTRPEPAREAGDEVELRRRVPGDAVMLRFVRRNHDALVLEGLGQEDEERQAQGGRGKDEMVPRRHGELDP